MDEIHELVLNELPNMKVYNLSLLINTYANLIPDQIHKFNDLAPELHEKLIAGINTEKFRAGELLK
jgi:hypothetical protein